MTTPALRLGAALLGLALLLPPAFAQEDDRTLRHADDGATTTLTARQEGDAWRVELTRERSSGAGSTSQQQVQLMFPRTETADRELEALFEDPPADPDEWVRRIEELAKIDIDVDVEGEAGVDAEGLRELSERMRDEVRQGFEQARAQLRELMDRARDEGARDEGAVTTASDTDRVWMKGGGQVEGELLSVDASTVRVKTATGGEVELPREQVRRIELAGDGAARAQAPAVLGVAISDEEGGGARVEAVREGTAAATAGLRERDVIVSFDGQTVRDSAHLRQVVAAHAPGDSVTLSVRRGEEELELNLTLGTLPVAPIPDPGMGPF